MKSAVVNSAVGMLATGIVALAAGCAHEYLYVPVGPSAGGGPAARYPVPPQGPQGEAYVTSFGFTDLDAGPGGPGRLLHARLAVSNGANVVWTVDGREQALTAPGRPAQAPTFLNTDAGTGPIYEVPPGQARVFDLYFALPPPLDQAVSLQGFSLDWRVNAGGQPVGERTAFQRMEGSGESYDRYPPYVAVGLGFGVGWWYGPFYPYRYQRPPVIRRYYFPPGRVVGGPWRGAPPNRAGWRGTPPGASGGLRGSPPPAAAGGWRGTPPTGNSVRAAPAAISGPRSGPRSAPSRGSSRGGGGHGHGR